MCYKLVFFKLFYREGSMKFFIVFFIVFFFVSCDSGADYSLWYSEPEYTGEDGELGGRCISPRRTCYCYPQCYCEGDNLKCTPMPDYEKEENDEDIIDDGSGGPPDGWGGSKE
jgi:hypothetical protein